MKRIVFTKKAKKDIKRLQGDSKKIDLLTDLLFKLANNEVLDSTYHVHELKGEYAGCLECHIQGDFLLVWIDDDAIKIIRVGSHSELASTAMTVAWMT
ncbi:MULTISPECIES: type II toxin-antitoxin system YafQ family toxin [Parabacteroides]|jgi:addiction module toxin, relE/stbE family|uniref:type II toxin-antitoxin system YafQ family toxin n=1 Tax=Parabacteroides TaxID=375288 RepID=UPI000F002996|nr:MULTISPECIES: type II toxin-antitoxin system YafQ family toxin [Parabacteroides]RKU58923.1 type II toxin-antitoxin system YafQ family toxin [Parabacteroides sp. AF19-14]